METERQRYIDRNRQRQTEGKIERERERGGEPKRQSMTERERLRDKKKEGRRKTIKIDITRERED